QRRARAAARRAGAATASRELIWPGSALRVEARSSRMPFEGEADELVDQLPVRKARCLPQLRVHRDRREPGDRVELVDQEATASFLVEEVHARHAVDPQRAWTSSTRKLAV